MDTTIVPAKRLVRRFGFRFHSISMGRLSKRALALGAAVYPEALPPMPRTRAECPVPSECVYFRCRYHLALDVSPTTGSITFNVPVTVDADGVPDLDLSVLPYRCALEAADQGGMTLDAVGTALRRTRERIRQIETGALARAAAANAVLKGAL